MEAKNLDDGAGSSRGRRDFKTQSLLNTPAMNDEVPQAFKHIPAEDRQPFPLEDGSTNCAARGLMAGLIGMFCKHRILLICFLNFERKLTSYVSRYPSRYVHRLLQYHS